MQVDELLKQEVSRKDFLQYIGVGLVSLVGLGGVVKALNIDVFKPAQPIVASYGGSAYGGRRRG